MMRAGHSARRGPRSGGPRGSALRRLGEIAGIASGYRDAWGRDHRTTDGIRVALLKAMGVVAGPEGVEAALRERQALDWRRGLPPVAVRRQPALPYEWEFCVDEAAANRTLRWTLALESGEVLNGNIRPADLRIVARGNVNGDARLRLVFQWHRRLPTGYHRFQLAGAGAAARSRMNLIIVPLRCYTEPGLADGGRTWGPALQLYAVRSRRNWGMGDFTDLRGIVELMGREGAGVVGLNPVHALFPDDPARASPYSPSSRNYLNPLYIDVEAIPEFAACRAARDQVADSRFQSRLRALREAEHIDYPAVAGMKLAVLRTIYEAIRERRPRARAPRAAAFDRFFAEGGESLRQFALYQALQEHFQSKDAGTWGWPVWPKAFRNPRSPAVREFHESHCREVAFYAWLQWIADEQLAACAELAREMGLKIGLYRDLAVSVDRAGAEAWAWQDIYAESASIGSPPDDFSPQGQDWSLVPAVPGGLAASGYAPFIATLRANMRHAGALRVDHVMGLARLYWVPRGATPARGAYVRYPLEDMLGILALESQRNRCMVIGEDLGTLPEGFRERLAPAGVLTYRLLFFEKDPHGRFKRPSAYPGQALVAVSTHDLPTLRGYWSGRDLEMRSRLSLYPSDAMRARQRAARKLDRERLLAALKREGLLPPGTPAKALATAGMTPKLGRAIHEYLARGRSWVMMVQAEDVFGQVEQMNVPATTGQYPNWRLKLSPCLEEWAADARFGELTGVLRRLRGADSDEKAGRFQRGRNWRPEGELLGGHNTKKNKENKVVPHRLPLRGHGS